MNDPTQLGSRSTCLASTAYPRANPRRFVAILWAAALWFLGQSSTKAEEDRAALEKQYESLHQAYLKSLYQTQKPVLEAQLAALKEWQTRITGKNHPTLLASIKEEIKTVEKQIKDNSKALEGSLKKIDPLTSEKVPPSHAHEEPKALVADFATAELDGGVSYLPKTKELRGWHSSQARARWEMPTEKGTSYEVKLTYATTSKDRLKVTVGNQRFTPQLADTKGLNKKSGITVGQFTADSLQTTITLTPALFRSREYLRVYQLELRPIPTP